jgi:oligopeptide transport system substrate-binding protein
VRERPLTSPMTRKTWLIILFVLLLLCVLTGTCGLGAYLAYDYLRIAPEAPPQASATRPVERTASSSGTLRISGGLPPTLDPALVQDSTSAEYVVHIFAGLVSLDQDLDVVPDVASRYVVSEDGLSYTFYLRPEATFHDGRAITAEDVVYSMERACRPETGSPVASSYLDDIVGARAVMQGQAERISGLEAVDEHTLRITIDAPKAYFLAKLTYPVAFVVDRVQIEAQGDAWITRPNGSGPYKLASISRDLIALEANDAFYGHKPSVRRVEYVLSGGHPLTMYETGELDIVQVVPSEVERVTDPENPLSRELVTGAEPSVQYLGFNVTEPPFDDRAVRQAFAHAIDRTKIADLVLRGTATAAKGILPPAMPDFDPTLEGLAYDPARARELLASSRYGGEGAMPPIVLSVSGTSGYLSTLDRAILSMLEENLGIEATVEQVEWSDFLQDLNACRYAFFSAGWIADFPDSQNFVDLLFHSASSQNHMGYANPEVDRLLEEARIEDDPERRTALYRQAERIIVEDAPWIPLTHGVVYVLVKPHVRGYRATGAISPWLHHVTLER